MLPISSLSSSVYSLTPKFSSSISFSSLMVFIVLFLLNFSPFHHLQFLSSLPQYSWSYLLSDHLDSFLVVNLLGNSPLLNVPSSLSCLLMSSISHWYSFLNSSTASFVFSKFSFFSQVLDRQK